MRSSLPSRLRYREGTDDKAFASWLSDIRVRSFDFSKDKLFKSVHKGGVTWLDLDPVEHRFLLSASADASIAAYDVLLPPENDSATQAAEHTAVFNISKGHPDAHEFVVSAVAWYPIDSGLFVSGSVDKEVKVWDANSLEVACRFAFPWRVYALSMSAVASAHCLVAVSGAEHSVQLCDPASGGFTHTLTGHRDNVWALHWSPASEWVLVSGGCDGQVRVWDIRTAGTLHVLDQHRTQKPARKRQLEGGLQRAPRAGGSNRTVNGISSRRSAAHAPPPASAPPSRHSAAHDGFVTAVVPLPNCLHWLSAGTDSRVRLWDAYDYRNMLVNYERTHNSALKGRQLAVTPDSRMLFHPSGSVVQMLDCMTGKELKLLRGHLDTVNCCAFNPTACELYSGSNDHNILVWAPVTADPAEDAEGQADVDAWSEED